MITFNVITPVTRPENLPRMALSLVDATRHEGFSINWLWRYDLERKFVGGYALKNEMLNEVSDLFEYDNWVFFLDDDTTCHPSLFQRVVDEVTKDTTLQAVVVSQERFENGAEVGRLHAKKENVFPGGIDQGQAVIRRDIIGDTRIPTDTYFGDGIFLTEVLTRGINRVKYVDEFLSYFNYLR